VGPDGALTGDLHGSGGMEADSGWKQVHSDVFRKPRHLVLFAALLGAGWQLAALVVLVILLAISEPYYDDRGAVASSVLGCYALSSFAAGYKSGGYYKQFFHPRPAPNWIKTMGLTLLLFPLGCCSVGFLLNSVALLKGTMNAVPFGTLVKVFLIWLVVAVPLGVAGTIAGRRWSGKSNFPCRVGAVMRPIPPPRWYSTPLFLIAATGVLPFFSIFIEMYFIFTSFWNYKFYYVYGFMLLVYFILATVTVCVTIVTTYFLLNAEDWRWQWIAFLSAGSTAGYVWLYSVYYFFARTSMTGYLQTAFYFGYMGIFCFGLWLLCGTLGTAGSTLFVKRIYRNIKCD